MYTQPARPGRTGFLKTALLCLLCQSAAASTSTVDTEIEELRQALGALKADYESRILELENRLDRALAAVATASPDSATTPGFEKTQSPAPPTPGVAVDVPASRALAGTGTQGNSAFNPAIGVIFQGQAWQSRLDEDAQDIPGFPLGGEAGPTPQGLALGETEIDISANVDDLFTAWLTVPIVIEDSETHVELEEAWIETLGLPGGLSTRFGRFYSGIGYLNGKHSHSWDFVDQPLAYQVFLGNQYLDDGVQLRWLPPTDLYVELGAELLRGDRYPAAGAANGGIGSQTLFARAGGDVGVNNSWQAGLSWLHSESRDRESGAEDAPLLFTGDSDLLIAEVLWKWAPQGNWRQRNLILQSEFLWRNEEGRYLLPDGSNPDINRDQHGWYLQAIYQPLPQWRVGTRIDLLSSSDPGSAYAGTTLEPVGDDPQKYTFMLDWSHSEFSRLRLQYARDLSAPQSNDSWGLQYIHSIGAHGAHSF